MTHSDFDNAPFFSVIIPTRNRFALFKKAYESVLNQTFSNFEIVVINDGSDEDALAQYKAFEATTPPHVHFRYQIRRPNGHGQSYSMNTGALVGKGEYLCFLDDDDVWTDPEHLERAHKSITASTTKVDAYYTNQKAVFVDGNEKPGPIWLDDLSTRLAHKQADSVGSYSVSAAELLTAHGFAHLNCSIVRRALYLSMKGMDENIRWECDHDFYLRTLDNATTVLFNPAFIAKHLIPDTQKKENMTTMVSMLEKRLYQVTVFEKCTLLLNNPAIKAYSQKRLAYTFQHITNELVLTKRTKEAAVYARKALACRFTIRWQVFCYWLQLKALFS